MDVAKYDIINGFVDLSIEALNLTIGHCHLEVLQQKVTDME